LWGADLAAAIAAYRRGLVLDPTDATTHFRLGFALCRRYDSAQRQAGDFQEVVNEWSRALALNPNQYI
jgi:tetratricopeptide (TPR) repeat protein